MSPPTDYTPDDFETMAGTHDMYDRLAATLSQPDIDEHVTRAVTLQLAGAPTRPQDLGENIRGDIHLAIVSGATANLSRFLSAVVDLAPLQTAHLNGTNTTLAGAIGSVSGSELTPGPILDETVELTVIEQLDSTGGRTHDAFQQIIDTGAYSFAKSNYRETVPASGSILIGNNPKYGNFDQYEPIGEQLNLTPALLAGVDLAITNIPNHSSPVQTSEDPLPVDLARQYLAHARTINPTLTDETTAELDTYLTKLKQSLDEDQPYTLGIARLRESLSRFALAHARLRLSTQTAHSDATRAITLVEQVFSDIGIDPDIGEFDADVVETGISKSQRDRIKNLKGIVADIEGKHENGAPVEEVISTAVETGMDRSKVEHELEKLKRKAEIYEPHEDHLYTT
jgi:replicative DNA helicase Mcm